MTRLYLVRHGETLWNIQGRMQGRCDSPLTEEGILRVRDLGGRLKEEHFAAVYSSTAGRALRTTELILRGRDVEIIESPDLREIDLGNWEGRKFDDIDMESPDNFRRFWEDPQRFVPQGGESAEELLERGTRVIRKIVDEHPGEKVLVVSHYCILKAILIHLQGRPLKELWDNPELAPASLTVYDTDTGELELTGTR